MSKSFNRIGVLTGLLLSITCAACGRAAVTPRSQEGQLRAFALDEPAATHDADGSGFDDPAGARALRRMADDSSLEDARAARSGWAASDAR